MSEAPLTRQDLALFYEVSRSLHAIRGLDEMLQDILKKIRAVFQIEGVSIALHDAKAKEFYFIKTVEAEINSDFLRMRRMRFPDHVGVAGWVLREGRPIVIPDVAQDKRFYNGVDLKESFITRSMICVPLRTRRGLIGVLYALNKKKGKFTEKEGRLLDNLSGTIAIAIENARLYGELKQYAHALAQENRRLRSDAQDRFNLQGIVGSSPAMRRLFLLMEKVIDTDITVLIQGETGTGKELIAKVIHYMGLRKDRPFAVENCGAFAENLLESELFGHVRGAFTGALSNKKGLFEMGDKGTVFLDEISETSTAMQVKLLRVIQEGQVRPVGAEKPVDIDIRLLASTNRDLETEVKNGKFRQDLFFRINVFPLVVPPLRERKTDIPLLAGHFLERYARKLKRPVTEFTPRALEYLTLFDWPGNVRELENEIERAIALSVNEKRIRVSHLSDKIVTSARQTASVKAGELKLKDATRRLEKKMVTDALKLSNGNRSQAARLLGLTRQGLLNKIERYDISV